jgi:alpha-tubulin suppressor-like RCC1 family protein
MKMRVSPPPARLWAAAALLAVAACSDPTGSDGPGGVASIDVVSGDLQTATVGTELPQPLVVKATDARGRPIPGLVVNFRVTAGNGSVFAGSTQTDAAGEARERWTLGTSTADTQRVEVRAADPATGVPRTYATFRALARAGDPASIEPVGSPAYTGTVAQPLPSPLAARVRDAYGNPVPGAAVVWTVKSGGGTLSPATSTTGGDGATYATWTLGTRVDSVQVAEAAAGLTLKTTFTARASAGFGVTLVKRSGDNQTGPVLRLLPAVVRVAVLLPDGRPLVGATVVWQPTPGSGGTRVVANTTDQNGESWAEWVLGQRPGVHTIVASVEGVGQVTFTATATAGPPYALFVTGNRQSGAEGTPLPDSVRVFVTDEYANPVSGAAVQWAVTGGGGGIAPATGVTDATGRAAAAWTLGPAGPQQATVTVGGLVGTLTATAIHDLHLVPARTLSAWSTTCAVTPAGALYCWGPNGDGQVGDGTVVDRAAPVRIRPDLTWATVSVGAQHTCALTTAGAAYCWGRDPITAIPALSPTPVPEAPAFRAITAGGTQSCGIGETGAAYCWGDNYYGALGIGSSPRRVAAPTPVAGGLAFAQIDAGMDHTCGVTTGGAGYCWGAYEPGGLGTAPSATIVDCTGFPCATSPVPVAGGQTWRAISAGNRPTCGVTTADQAYCWGDIPPAGTFSYTGYQGTTPVAVQGGIAFRGVSAGDRHVCGVSTGNAAYCWGTNDAGQLGDGTTVPNSQPVNGPVPRAVAGGLSFAVVAAGVSHSCGITTGGAAYCWGAGTGGRLGTGSTSASLTPAPVAGGIAF